ncbi:LOW QUALITY PROTEIN: regulator of MON1-CCZ1 complex [Pholidichthys leucotaenia]
MTEQHYLELSESPVQFEHASTVNNVFFDEANKQVFAVRSGGATGVVVKGPDDKSSVAFRMDDKGEVKCIKFSIGNKILAVQRTSKSVDFINFIPDYPHTEFCQECKTKNANILGFCWTNWNEIIFITDQGIEFYQVFPDKRSLKLLKSQSINVNWYQYCPETAVILLSTTVQGNVLQPFAFRNGTMTKMSKFEIELPVVPKPAKLSLSERDVAMATIYGQLYVMYLKHHSRTANSPSAEVVLYHLPREGTCKKRHVLKLTPQGKFALNVVDNLVVVHHQSSQTSLIFDIKLKESDSSSVSSHQPVPPPAAHHPYRIPLSGPAVVPSQPPVPSQLYSSSWSVFQPDIIISASEGYLWYLQVKAPPQSTCLQDKGKLMDFPVDEEDCKMVILSVCSQLLEEEQKGSLPVVATVFDKLNQVYYKDYHAEQSYAQAIESGPSRGGAAAQKRPIRTQAVIDQSDMYTHVLSAFTERKGVSHKFVVAVLMEYIRSLNQNQIMVQHYLYELVSQTLAHHLFYMPQFLQYHVLSDSKPLACLLLSLESTYPPPAHQLSLDMLKRLSTANDEIVEVLLSKQQVLGALRFIRSVGGHDNVSARKFLDAARQTGDQMLFYTVFRSFQQRNQRLRGSPVFNPGEHCEEHVAHFRQLFGDQALMKPSTV